MYDELKNKPELRKSITHITLSITVLTTIAVIIRLFTKILQNLGYQRP